MPPPLDLVPPLVGGAVVTVQIAVLSMAVVIACAFIAGFATLSKHRLVRSLAAVYIELFRGTSLLVQVFFIFFVLPVFGLRLDAMTAGVLAIGLNFGAYGSQVVRAAVLAVDAGQHDATLALGMGEALAMRRIVLPQALVTMLPPFGNLAVETLKATPLVSVIAIQELGLTAKILRENVGRTDEVYAVTLFIYFALALPLTAMTRMAERRVGRGLSLGRTQ